MSDTSGAGPKRGRRWPVPFASLHPYDRAWLRGDVIAGLTVWAVLVPEALAYATIAGVPPVVGLYAAPAALLFYALLGSSRQLVVGPMSATAALSAAAVAQVAAPGDDVVALTAALAITTGLVAAVAGLMRLGFLANFISEPVLKGFIVGLALTIIIGQVPSVLGIDGGSGNFFEKLWHILGNLGDVDGATLVVGVASLVCVMGLKHFAPVVPASLVAVIGGIVAVHLFDLQAHGVEIVGHIDAGLPSIGLADVDASRYLDLGPSAAAIMLVGFAEGLAAARNYAARRHEEVDANRELLGLGGANLASGLVSGMVVNGSLSKTAVNAAAGARSQVSGLVVAVLTIVTLLLLTSLFEDLPEATLGAVVIAAVIELVDYRSLVGLYRATTTRLGRLYGFAARADFLAAATALAGVLIFDTLPGLFLGIAVSLVLLLYRASRPHVAELGELPGTERYVTLDPAGEVHPVPGIAIIRPEGSLFFANADAVRKEIRDRAARPGTDVVVLDAEAVPTIDVTAVRMLHELAEELRSSSVQLVLARDVEGVRELVRREGGDDEQIAIYPTVHMAVRAARATGAGSGRVGGGSA